MRKNRKRITKIVFKSILIFVSFILVIGLGVLGFFYNQGKKPPTTNREYVALGSSFVSGPGVGERSPESPWLCNRSDSNYAHLVVKKTGLNLTDISCSGATTDNILNQSQFFTPPQIEAVTKNTKLVTITVGGNDLSYIGNLIAWSSQNSRNHTPFMFRIAGLDKPTPQSTINQNIQRLPNQLDKMIQTIQKRAPHARIILVDYLRVLPEKKSCAKLPLSEEQLESSQVIAKKLTTITEHAAKRNDVDFINGATLGKDHDVCSKNPYIQPYGSFSSYHLNQAGMNAVSEAILQIIEK